MEEPTAKWGLERSCPLNSDGKRKQMFSWKLGGQLGTVILIAPQLKGDLFKHSKQAIAYGPGVWTPVELANMHATPASTIVCSTTSAIGGTHRWH